MFKFLRKKLLEGLINDFINEMPKWRVSARILFREKKDEILKKAKDSLYETLKRIFEQELS